MYYKKNHIVIIIKLFSSYDNPFIIILLAVSLSTASVLTYVKLCWNVCPTQITF